MSNPYVLHFSDPAKQAVVEIPEMPPGINTIDTSLSLVGRGYPNYGQKIAENFLHLLENFASAMPPENPIEGQLWYDTSDPTKKVLRVMDGTSTTTRWPSASGIYQQGSDPKLDPLASLKVGDIWVDTANSQLKIFNSNDWITVGPVAGGTEVTGPVVTSIEDTAGIFHKVIINYVNGDSTLATYSGAVSVISDASFTPKIVIPGFTKIVAGVNLSSKINESTSSPIFNGTALKAQNLLTTNNETVSSDLFLRKDDQTPYGQVITGRVVFQTPQLDEVSGQGINGVIVTDDATTFSSNYVQFYKADTNAILLNNVDDGSLIVKTKRFGSVPSNVFEVSSSLVSSYTNTKITKDLSVLGGVSVNNLSVFNGDVIVNSTATVANLLVSGSLRNSNKLIVGTSSGSGIIIEPAKTNAYNIGSSSAVFNRVYANYVGTGNTVFYGNVSGSATKLTNATNFRITGQIETTADVAYDGQTNNATFDTVINPTAISDQVEMTVPTSTLQVLVLDTADSTLYKINKDKLLSSTSPTGMISAFGSNVNIPIGWLLCDGSVLTRYTNYDALFEVIGYSYGGAGNLFHLPNFTSSASNGTIYYIIKT